MGYGGDPDVLRPDGRRRRTASSAIDRRDAPRASRTGRDRQPARHVRHARTCASASCSRRCASARPERRRAASRASRRRRAWRARVLPEREPASSSGCTPGRRAVGTEPAREGGAAHAPTSPSMRQLGLLMSRYWKVKIRDRAGAAIMFLQAPIIGVMLAFVFGGAEEGGAVLVPRRAARSCRRRTARSRARRPTCSNSMKPTTDHTAAMFFVVVSCVWFGTSNAAREIVTERAIYLRERMVNLLALQLRLLEVHPARRSSASSSARCCSASSSSRSASRAAPQRSSSSSWRWSRVAMNATRARAPPLDASVASAEAAMALTPIALIPQVVLGGLMVPMTTNPMLKPLMYVMPARWGFEGAIAQERAAHRRTIRRGSSTCTAEPESAADFVVNGHFQCAIAQIGSDTITGAWGFTEWNDVGPARSGPHGDDGGDARVAGDSVEEARPGLNHGKDLDFPSAEKESPGCGARILWSRTQESPGCGPGSPGSGPGSPGSGPGSPVRGRRITWCLDAGSPGSGPGSPGSGPGSP